jgi:Glycosyl transferases group 1
LLEAQACGIPAVGTRTGGIADAVQDGRGGWLIGQDDVLASFQSALSIVTVPRPYCGRMTIGFASVPSRLKVSVPPL